MNSKSKTEQPEPAPVPQLAKTVVSVKATIPMQQYGNIEIFVSNEIFIDAQEAETVRSATARAMMDNLRNDIAAMVLPLANEEVIRCKSVLVKEHHPDAWMQRNSPPYRWLRAAAPNLPIPEMQEILASRDVAPE